MFPPDIQYCMDHDMWTSDISGDVYVYCGEYHENFVDWFDNTDVPFNLKNLEMKRFLDEWRKTASLQQKVFLSIHGIKSIYGMKHEYVLELKDLGAKLSNLQCKKQFPKLVYSDSLHFNGILNQVSSRAREDFAGLSRQDLIELFLAEEEIIETKYKKIEEIVREHAWKLSDDKIKEIEDKNKKTIDKASELLTSFIGQEDTELFLGKNHISITGNLYDYRIAPNNLFSDHSGLDIEILCRKTKQKLSNLCFYYEGINAVDQAMAFVLDVKNGNEKLILETGNPFNQNKDVANNPFVKETPKNEDLGRIFLSSYEQKKYGNLKNYSARMDKLISFAKPVIDNYIENIFGFENTLEGLKNCTMISHK